MRATTSPANATTAAVGTAYSSAAEMSMRIKGNRLKLLLAAILPWKRDIRITVSAAAIFIGAPPRKNDYQRP
jgi:hypothetical protein